MITTDSDLSITTLGVLSVSDWPLSNLTLILSMCDSEASKPRVTQMLSVDALRDTRTREPIYRVNVKYVHLETKKRQLAYAVRLA